MAKPFRYPLLLAVVLTTSSRLLGSQAPQPATANSVTVPPVAEQIAAAVLPAPADLREAATVLGYDAAGKLVTLREGSGALTCLASDPRSSRFHVACYHKSMEPFMARGRSLRADGVKPELVDSVRFHEVKRGKLRMPKEPAVLYSLTGKAGTFDPATGTASGARQLFVIYVPGATAQSLGISAVPAEGVPWVMNPGTPKAHIMFVPRM
ncbi:MAG TPA: hypothetical protein VNO75_07680 [Gemmatimonadaceae bacterium]|nr:hypothetical protein [Gemmatimonadaceae bacterium]